MRSKNIFSVILLLLFAVPLYSSILVSVYAPEEPDDSEISSDLYITLTVYPDGEVAVEGTFEELMDERDSGFWEGDVNMSFISMGTDILWNLRAGLPPNETSEFPFNSSQISMTLNLSDDLWSSDLNLSTILPPEMASLFPLNVTDITINGKYGEGDLLLDMDISAIMNLTKIAADMFDFMPMFNRTFDYPLIVQLNYSKGDYEGQIISHLVAGVPLSEILVDVEGNLTMVRLAGNVTAVYGNYFGTEINSTYVNQLENYLETLLTGPIGTGGSLLNITDGALNCTYKSIERENMTGGEDVSFEVWLEGDFIEAITSMMLSNSNGNGEDISEENATQLISLVNEFLLNIQNSTVEIVYNPSDNILQFTMDGVLHLKELLHQLSETIIEEAPQDPTNGSMSTYNYFVIALVSLNNSIEPLQQMEFQLTYEHEMGRVNVSSTSTSTSISENSVEPNEFLIDMLSQYFANLFFDMSLDEIGQQNISSPLQEMIINSVVGLSSMSCSISYENGIFEYTQEGTLEENGNALANNMKSYLLELLFAENETEQNMWQLQYLNDTVLDVSSLELYVSMTEDAASVKLDGLTIFPPVDTQNNTVFNLERLLNLTADSYSSEGPTLSLLVAGGSNSTHKIVMDKKDAPTPDLELKDASDRIMVLQWNNVTLASLKNMEFIIVGGNQVSENLDEPEKISPENPVIINASEQLGTSINITGISDNLFLILSNVTEPEGVQTPPGTWKVLGNYVQITVSNESVSVNATIRMDYTDEQVTQAGVDESTLKIHYWNGTSWETVEPSYVNAEENYVWAETDHFSLFTLLGDVPPLAVAVSIGTISENNLDISWTQNSDPDFARYEIYISTIQGQLGDLVQQIAQSTTTTYTASSLSSGTTYYFTVRVWDTVGLYTDSTKEATTTNAIWQETWFIGSVAGVAAVAIAAIIIIKRRK